MAAKLISELQQKYQSLGEQYAATHPAPTVTPIPTSMSDPGSLQLPGLGGTVQESQESAETSLAYLRRAFQVAPDGANTALANVMLQEERDRIAAAGAAAQVQQPTPLPSKEGIITLPPPPTATTPDKTSNGGSKTVSWKICESFIAKIMMICSGCIFNVIFVTSYFCRRLLAKSWHFFKWLWEESPNIASKTSHVKVSVQQIYRYLFFCVISFYQNLSLLISNQYTAWILYPSGEIYYHYLRRLVYVLTMNESLGKFGSNVQVETAIDRIISHVMIYIDIIDIHREEQISNYEATIFFMHHVSLLLTKCGLLFFLLLAINVPNIPYFIIRCVAYFWYHKLHFPRLKTLL